MPWDCCAAFRVHGRAVSASRAGALRADVPFVDVVGAELRFGPRHAYGNMTPTPSSHFYIDLCRPPGLDLGDYT